MNNFKTNELNYLFNSVFSKYKVDLSNYALASLERRIERFLSLYFFEDLIGLSDKLIADDKFYDLFIKEITVNTTEMFRDPSCWKSIRENVIPFLRDLPSIRIWHAGCSSGEEVYTMAILLQEEGVFNKSKIIASDLNRDVIESAKKGCYSIKSLELNEENYIHSGGSRSFSDYLKKEGNSYCMNQELLENVRFLRHDLSTGDLFSKFDIIICRNVMIYFNKNLQEKVFSIFQNSLFKKGFVIIGKKESMAYYTNARMFAEVNEIEKIYRLK